MQISHEHSKLLRVRITLDEREIKKAILEYLKAHNSVPKTYTPKVDVDIWEKGDNSDLVAEVVYHFEDVEPEAK